MLLFGPHWVYKSKVIKIKIIRGFQGYVCPGILVTMTNEDNVKVLEDCWHKHTLRSPIGFKIYRLGLSGGCSVTPFNQVTRQFELDRPCLQRSIKDRYQVLVYAPRMICVAFKMPFE